MDPLENVIFLPFNHPELNFLLLVYRYITYSDVHFPKGVRNKFHKHANDQVLIVIKGHGIVATCDQKIEVKEGDVIWTPAGEEHWHGAILESEFSHISVTKAHTKITQVEK